MSFSFNTNLFYYSSSVNSLVLLHHSQIQGTNRHDNNEHSTNKGIKGKSLKNCFNVKIYPGYILQNKIDLDPNVSFLGNK